MKIKLEKEKIEEIVKNEENIEKTPKKVGKNSFFKIFSIILLVILTIALIIEIVLIIVYNNKIDSTKDDINNIPSISQNYDKNEYSELNIEIM